MGSLEQQIRPYRQAAAGDLRSAPGHSQNPVGESRIVERICTLRPEQESGEESGGQEEDRHSEYVDELDPRPRAALVRSSWYGQQALPATRGR